MTMLISNSNANILRGFLGVSFTRIHKMLTGPDSYFETGALCCCINLAETSVYK